MFRKDCTSIAIEIVIRTISVPLIGLYKVHCKSRSTKGAAAMLSALKLSEVLPVLYIVSKYLCGGLG